MYKIIEAREKNRELTIDSNISMDSSTPFYGRDGQNRRVKHQEQMANLSVLHLIILAQCHAQDNARDVVKIVNPLFPVETVSCHADHANPGRIRVGWKVECCLCDPRALLSALQDVPVSGDIIGASDSLDLGNEATS